jgi:tetratricopeptide (TPR) repeat protein
MSDQQPPEPAIAALVAGARRGAELQSAGRDAEALEEWNRLLNRSPQVEGEKAALMLATVMYSKAQLLLSLNRPAEAEALAAHAIERLDSVSRASARQVAARAQGIRRSAFTQLGQHDRALAIDERLVVDYAGSESFELRANAGQALVHAVWTHGHRGEEEEAIARAQQLVDLFSTDEDPDHLIEIGQLLLSGAEKLNHRRIWRRASAPITTQVKKMCDATVTLAGRVGGDLGEAVTLSARLTQADALVEDHRLRAVLH